MSLSLQDTIKEMLPEMASINLFLLFVILGFVLKLLAGVDYFGHAPTIIINRC